MRPTVNKSCRVGPEIAPEQFISEHLFFYLVTGELNGFHGDKAYGLKAGEYGLARKNRLGRYDNQKVNDDVEKVVFILDETFLRAFQEKHKITPAHYQSDESFIIPKPNRLIPEFIHSLLPYYDDAGKLDMVFFDVKREELLLILLQSQPELSGIFFDYSIPGKIDLEEFMNRNYKFNVSMERFAYMTGRSLSAFKRDFKQIFNDTPNKWLIKKRLQEAHYQIEKKGHKPSEIYLDLGFEDLSHFSFSFKKLYGYSPSSTLGKTS